MTDTTTPTGTATVPLFGHDRRMVVTLDMGNIVRDPETGTIIFYMLDSEGNRTGNCSHEIRLTDEGGKMFEHWLKCEVTLRTQYGIGQLPDRV